MKQREFMAGRQCSSRSQLADSIGLRRKYQKHVAEATNVKQTLDLDGHPTKRELAIPL